MLKTNEIKKTLLISPMEAANELGVGRNMMYNLLKTEGFPRIRIKNKYFINKAKLQEWINEQCFKSNLK